MGTDTTARSGRTNWFADRSLTTKLLASVLVACLTTGVVLADALAGYGRNALTADERATLNDLTTAWNCGSSWVASRADGTDAGDGPDLSGPDRHVLRRVVYSEKR
jgi:hypothetical protein